MPIYGVPSRTRILRLAFPRIPCRAGSSVRGTPIPGPARRNRRWSQLLPRTVWWLPRLSTAAVGSGLRAELVALMAWA